MVKLIELAVVCLEQNLLSRELLPLGNNDVPRLRNISLEEIRDPAEIQTEDSLNTSQILLLVSDWFKSSDTFRRAWIQISATFTDILCRFISQCLRATSENCSYAMIRMGTLLLSIFT